MLPICIVVWYYKLQLLWPYSKDVRLPVQLQRAMAAEAEAAREARAKVIAAEGEQRASRALKEAAEVINESPAALQVLYIIYSHSIPLSSQATHFQLLTLPLSSFPLSPGRYTCPLSPTLPLPCSPLSVLYCTVLPEGQQHPHRLEVL